MSASSDLTDVLRRRAVGSRTELTVEATMAAMAIRSAFQDNARQLRRTSSQALAQMLDRIDEVARYKQGDHLRELVRSDRVVRDSAQLAQVMARAAVQEDMDDESTTPELEFPVLDSLIASRKSVQLDSTNGVLTVLDQTAAESLAAALEELANEVLTEAVSEDRTRTSSYAVM